MHPSVSQFTLHQSRQPSLKKSLLHTPKPADRQQLLMKEIIVEVRDHFERAKHPSHLSSIRWQIDSCLHAIQDTRKLQNNTELSPQNADPSKIIHQRTPQSIHRVDNRLILEYLQTVAGQYSLHKNFKRQSARNTTFFKGQTPKTPNYSHQRPASLGGTSRGKKQYLQLTQASKQGRRSNSVFKSKPANIPNYLTEAARGGGKIGYCLGCDSAVEMSEVDSHQQHSCSRLQELYRMEFQELLKIVEETIQIVEEQLGLVVDNLRQKKEGQYLYTQLVGHSIQQIEGLLQKGAKREPGSFIPLRESLDNAYNRALQLTHRLHWFTVVRLRLNRVIQGRGRDTRGLLMPTTPISRLLLGDLPRI